jgi:hypothetical protein
LVAQAKLPLRYSAMVELGPFQTFETLVLARADAGTNTLDAT